MMSANHGLSGECGRKLSYITNSSELSVFHNNLGHMEKYFYFTSKIPHTFNDNFQMKFCIFLFHQSLKRHSKILTGVCRIA